MIRRKCKYNSLSERNKRTTATNSPKSSSSWSLFTIQDASEDSGQSSGADEYKENEHKNEAYINDAIRNKPNEAFHESVAKLRHMQMCESVHKELKQILSNKNKLTRKAFVEPRQSHLGKETKLPSNECMTSNHWESSSKHVNPLFATTNSFPSFYSRQNLSTPMFSSLVETGDRSEDAEIIRGETGSVRGVRNKVRSGIATFIDGPIKKNGHSVAEKRVIVFTTSLGIIRQTRGRCAAVKSILNNLMCRFEERDVFMSKGFLLELRTKFLGKHLVLPQVFINEQYLGGADIVEKFNELGELREMLREFKCSPNVQTHPCLSCGGYFLLPCPHCKGSKKSNIRNSFGSSQLRCSHCDDGGLVQCMGTGHQYFYSHQ